MLPRWAFGVGFIAVLLAGTAVAQNVANYKEQGGARWVIGSGGSLDVASGGELDVESGGALKVGGTQVTSSAAELNVLDGVTKTYAEINALAGGVAGGYKIARGETALDGSNPTDVASGLTTIVACALTIKATTAPTTDTVTYGTSGATLSLYGWKPTAADNSALTASTGTETVGWICVGT